MANNRSDEFRKSVAEMFINGLRQDGLQWKKGWKTDGLLPENGATGAEYHGINRLNLFFTAMARGYEDTRWMTFNQIRDKGYHLQKGSKGTKIEYWFPYDRTEKKPISWEKYHDEILSGRNENDFTTLVKVYTVFNGDNIEGLPEKEIYRNLNVEPSEIINNISTGMSVPIIHDAKEDRSYYIPSKDEIHLPLPEKFMSTEAYNATALHELAHSTGHPERLNREKGGEFGDEKYAFEELVAEITSVFMSVHTGIDPADMDMETHQAYVNDWIEVIEKSPDVLVKAVKQAEAAADYMEEKGGITKELEKIKEAAKGKDREDMIQKFNDKFYGYGVYITKNEEVMALRFDGKWITWFEKSGFCHGNTDQLNIWLCDRGELNVPGDVKFVSPTSDEAIEMVKGIAEFYDISITEKGLGRIIDLEDLAELESIEVAEKAGEILKESAPKNDISGKIREIFSGTEKEADAPVMQNVAVKRKIKAEELEL